MGVYLDLFNVFDPVENIKFKPHGEIVETLKKLKPKIVNQRIRFTVIWDDLFDSRQVEILLIDNLCRKIEEYVNAADEYVSVEVSTIGGQHLHLEFKVVND